MKKRAAQAALQAQISETCSRRRSPIAVAANAELGRGRRVFAANQTAKRRRQRRTRGMSMESTSRPSGTIQRSEIGRKPSSPKSTSRAPIRMRSSRERGSGSLIAAELHRVARPRIFHHSHQFYRPDLRLHDKWPRSAQNATGGWKAKHSARMMAVCLTSRARREPHAPRRARRSRSKPAQQSRAPILLFPTLHYRAHLAYMRR